MGDPGPVATLTVPVRAGPMARDCVELFIKVRARGGAGRRLRTRRGVSASARVSLPQQVLGALGGYAVWGGGVWFGFVNHRPVTDEGDMIGDPSVQAVWSMASASGADAQTALSSSVGVTRA